MPITPAMLRSTQLAEKTVRPVRAARQERSYSEETITPEVSLTVSAVLAAFTILSEDVSSLPLLLYARRGRNKIRAYDSLYYRLMHDQPNEEHTSMIFRELMMGHLLGWGNFYAQPIVDKRGDVQELWPLRPDRMTVERKQGERIYTYIDSEGKPRIFIGDEILHIPAFGFDGLVGYSRITMARNTIGLSISTEKFGSKFFSNGTNVGVIYKHPGALGDEAYGHLSDSLKEHATVENSHKPIILEEGMSIEKLGIPPDDAQFLETRKFQVSEIARIFRVPPHMIGDVERTTSWGAGIDSQEQGYVNHTLRPWATRIEQSLNANLLLKKDRGIYFYEHLMDGLLRGDIATRYEAYVKAINNGIMSPNEARTKENMNPYKDGDVFWRPLNMTKASDPVQDQAQPSNALEPLWHDAILRAVKREKNDVLGALKRSKTTQAFHTFVKNFYDQDHAAFLLKQLQPVIQAHTRIYGRNLQDVLEAEVVLFLQRRRDMVEAIPSDQVDAMFDDIEETVESFLNFVRTANEEAETFQFEE